jgi:hypothetical protein
MHHPRTSSLIPLFAALGILGACGSGGSDKSSAFTDNIAPTAGVVQDGIAGDIDAQTSLSTIRANWNGFQDNSGSIAEYRWAIGTTPGGTNVQEWVSVGTSTQATNSTLSLTLYSSYFVSVRAYDAAGNQSEPAVSDGVTTADIGDPEPEDPGSSTAVTQFGITWTFAEAEQVGQFANGDWWVVGPVSITDITPRTQTVNGRVIHGSMLNPRDSLGGHGYDTLLFSPYGNAYLPHLNVAAGVSPSTPLVLAGGNSLISVISWTSPNPPPSGSVSQLKTAAVLTVLSTTPPAGAFRPPYSGQDKTIRFKESDLDYTALASLVPASGAPNLNDVRASFDRMWLDHQSGWISRFIHPIDNMPDYGRDFTAVFGRGVLVANLNYTNQQKRDLVVRLVQIGIDYWGNVQAGYLWSGVGGQGSGRKFPILFAGALLNDAAMLGVGISHPSGYWGPGNALSQFGEDCQTFYVQETSPGVYNWGGGGYNATHVGMPEWGNGHSEAPWNDNADWFADAYRRCCTANAWVGQTLAARVMGLRAAWNHASYFDYMDRYMVTEPTGWTRAWDGWQEQMWNLHRPNY